MSDKTAFTYNIDPKGSGQDEDNSVHQSSPSWVLTFVRWENRDTQRIKGIPYTQVREPMIVENDCVQVTTTSNKGTLTPSMSATLVMSDINYETALAPGDFVFVNMLNSPSEARRVAEAARSKQAINGINDGFKGVFKIQGPRRILTTDPQSGTKIVLFRINGFGFTEFNNTIYLNTYLLDPNQDPQNQFLFASFIGNDWKNLTNAKGLTNVQDLIAVLIQSFIGTGINDQGFLNQKGALNTPNVHFFIPELVGSLLGITGAKAAKDVYHYLFGIQNYSSGASQTLGAGMNPSGLTEKFNKFFYTPTACSGDSLLKPEYWNQVKAWSILNQYTNAPLNELYTCFKVSPNNKIMPTVVFRQIPFTTDDFSIESVGPGSSGLADPAVTKFMTLPRWKINPALVLDQDIGREEAARVNFVQYFGKSSLGVNGADIAQEIAKGNYVYDIDDVQRSGLRPYIVTTQFDEPTDKYKDFKSPIWARIMGDALIGGHLKLNGTLTCAGLIEPITIGDNIEYDGNVFHIEQITHTCSINGQLGNRTFRTTISFSSGLSIESSSQGTQYAEMNYPSANALRKNDFKNNKILPGVSESQDVIYRPISVDQPTAQSKPFPQPGTQGTITKKGK